MSFQICLAKNQTILNMKLMVLDGSKRVSVACCGMECIDMTSKNNKYFRHSFSYNKKVENEEIFVKAAFSAKNIFG